MADDKVGETSNSEDGISAKEQHDGRYLLPIANVGRIMKQNLPPNAKISKESKETMQECVSEFIAFVTGEASQNCRRERRKTINGDDLCWAITALGFDDYAPPLRRYLLKYREVEADKSSTTLAAAAEEELPAADRIYAGVINSSGPPYDLLSSRPPFN